MDRDQQYDAFISYAHRDGGEWVHVLAGNLERLGVRCFLDDWEIGPGDVPVHGMDRGLAESRHGVLVVTPAAMASGWVQQEYAALLRNAVEHQRRLVPVLFLDAEMPPLLASFAWIDFRNVEGGEYEANVRRLADELQGKRPERPLPGESLVQPPGRTVRPVGPLRLTLTVSPDRVRLEGFEEPVEAPPRPVDHVLRDRIWRLQRARRLRAAADAQSTRELEAAVLHTDANVHDQLLEVGRKLAEHFLPGPVEKKLVAALEEARSHGVSLELGLRSEDPELSRLPWETLAVTTPEHPAGQPLVLHDHVELFRTWAGDGAAPVHQIPRPLRILVAIGSPEADNEREELLDYEQELARILDAVEPARDQGKNAYVRILHRGTVAAIRTALEEQRFHVLYISGHAGPGVLQLEDEEGKADTVSAQRLVAEALPVDRRPPLVVLAGCATALGTTETPEPAEPPGGGEAKAPVASYLPGLAEELLEHGVPAVIAMQASVSDRYATDLAAAFFQGLAISQEPDPLRNLSSARLHLERARRKIEEPARQPQAEWATPSLYLRGPVRKLYDPESKPEEIAEPTTPYLAPGVPARPVGTFVGRRREERLTLRALNDPRSGGILLHGLGGVGKSTLAAQLLLTLHRQRRPVVSVVGQTSPSDVLVEIGQQLVLMALERDYDEKHPYRQIAQPLRRPEIPGEERFELLARALLPNEPLVLLLDNFEDNLQETDGAWTLQDPELGTFLERWLLHSGRSHLIVTSRYPFALPGDAQHHLEPFPLGPLSFAETRKLIWRLPGLAALSTEDQRRAYAAVGGHPRTLEYLDALLRGGKAEFPDLQKKITTVLAQQKDIEDPEAWLAQAEGDLKLALAQAVTLSSDDVLLRQLLERVDEVPLARQLLIGMSVYRLPVDDLGLACQIAEQVNRSNESDLALFDNFNSRVARARSQKLEITPANLGYSHDDMQHLHQLAIELRKPPLHYSKDDLPRAKQLLLHLGLLAPEASIESKQQWALHSWTRVGIQKLSDQPELRSAHRRAAQYWGYISSYAESSSWTLLNILQEAFFHSVECGDFQETHFYLDQIWQVSDKVGAYRKVKRLYEHALSWSPRNCRAAAVANHQLGLISLRLDALPEAAEFFREGLAISRQLGNTDDMALAYLHLGIVAQRRGDYDETREQLASAQRLFEELKMEAGLAAVYHNYGTLSQLTKPLHEQDNADFHKALAIYADLNDRRGVAQVEHQLGINAQESGHHAAALQYFCNELQFHRETGDEASIASCHHHLGIVTLNASIEEKADEADLESANEHFRRELEIQERLGVPSGIAGALYYLSVIAWHRNLLTEARSFSRQALQVISTVEDPIAMANILSQLGGLEAEAHQSVEGLPFTLRSLSLRLWLGAADVAVDLHWLIRHRDQLGHSTFERILIEVGGEEALPNVLALMQQYQEAVAAQQADQEP